MMKRISISILALLLAFAMAAPAFAEVNMQGQFEISARWLDNLNFHDSDGDNTSEDDFTVDQRVRVYFEYIASENLRGVFGIQADNDWGAPGAGALGDDPNTLSVKHAYIDFMVPNTALNVRAGRFGFAPPANFGSPIWDDDVSGVTASYTFNDMVSLTVGYLRLVDALYGSDNIDLNLDGDTNDPQERNPRNDEVDAVAAILPITGDGWNLTPYAIYAWVGDFAYNVAVEGGDYVGGLEDGFNQNASEDDGSSVYWFGVPFQMTMFDPFTFYADVIYGAFDADNEENDRSGWFVDAAVDYAWADLFTLRVLGFYGTGDDDDVNDGSERMPTLGNNEGCCGLTTFGFDGSAAGWNGNDQRLTGNGYGFWGLGISLMDFSFIDKLSHTLTFVYGQGTNDEDAIKKNIANPTPGILNGGSYLTTEDSYFEINFDHTYQLYENLTAYLELGYIDVDADDDVWGNDDAEAASKLQFTLRYNY
jgi:hypothetical protein